MRLYMRLPISEIILTYILSLTVFQLSCSVNQIIAFGKRVPYVNAFLSNLWEYRHISYVA